MREFFHGWRRKVGCATTVMAIAVTASWVRSLTVHDTLWIRIGDTCQFVYHDYGHITWFSHSITEDHRATWPSFGRRSDVPGPYHRLPTWYFDSDTWMIAHWSLAVPMTLLSVYLILWPGKREPANSRADTEVYLR